MFNVCDADFLFKIVCVVLYSFFTIIYKIKRRDDDKNSTE
jgi:hypothetical protein